MLKLVKNLLNIEDQKINKSESIKQNQLLKNREDRFHVDQHLHFFKVWYGTEELKVQNISASGLAIESQKFHVGQKLTIQIEIDDLVFNEESEVVRVQNGMTAMRLCQRSDRFTVLFHRFFAIEKRAHDLSVINEKLFNNQIDSANAFWCRNSSGDEFFVEFKDNQILQLHIRVQKFGLQKNQGGSIQYGEFEKEYDNRAYGQWVLKPNLAHKKMIITNLIRFVDNIDLINEDKKQLVINYLTQI